MLYWLGLTCGGGRCAAWKAHGAEPSANEWDEGRICERRYRRRPESHVVLDITTDTQEFEKALQRAYRKVVGQVRLPGFRPGKAPRFIVEQMLGRETLIEQADRDLLDPLYQQAIEREQLNPVGEPEVEIYQTEPLAFKVTVQVYPTLDLAGYGEVRVEPRQIAITDEQVEEAIERLRSNRSPWNELAEERPAQEGDRITIDVALEEAGTGEPYREPIIDSVYVLGKDNLFPQLRDALIGANIGDVKTVEISFGEEEETAEAGMRGKTMLYTLTVKKLEEQELLPLDDDFALSASENRMATVDALRVDVRRDLLRAERQKARNEVASEVVNAMSALATVELPPVMIDKQVDSDIEELRNRLSQDQGQTLEGYLRLQNKTEAELREEFRPEAVRRLRNSLVLREIADARGRLGQRAGYRRRDRSHDRHGRESRPTAPDLFRQLHPQPAGKRTLRAQADGSRHRYRHRGAWPGRAAGRARG